MAELLAAVALLNESCVAKQLDCEVKTLQAWRCRGGGPPFVRVGRLIRYKPDDVQAWVESRRMTSTSEKVTPARNKRT